MHSVNVFNLLPIVLDSLEFHIIPIHGTIKEWDSEKWSDSPKPSKVNWLKPNFTWHLHSLMCRTPEMVSGCHFVVLCYWDSCLRMQGTAISSGLNILLVPGESLLQAFRGSATHQCPELLTITISGQNPQEMLQAFRTEKWDTEALLREMFCIVC